jgi:hypothetical protein
MGQVGRFGHSLDVVNEGSASELQAMSRTLLVLSGCGELPEDYRLRMYADESDAGA